MTREHCLFPRLGLMGARRRPYMVCAQWEAVRMAAAPFYAPKLIQHDDESRTGLSSLGRRSYRLWQCLPQFMAPTRDTPEWPDPNPNQTKEKKSRGSKCQHTSRIRTPICRERAAASQPCLKRLPLPLPLPLHPPHPLRSQSILAFPCLP